MARKALITLALAASTALIAVPALAQQARDPEPLRVRAGTAAPDGYEANELQDVKAPAPILGARVRPGYRVPRVLGGLPDLGGSWTNSTMTPQSRPAAFGNRAVLADVEARSIEHASDELIAKGNEASDVNATIKDIEAKANCSGGRSAAAQACNYDAGWTAPGDSVMRVNDQPRTSLLTTPDGQTPRAKRQSDRVLNAAANVGEGTRGADPAGRNDNPETRGLAERCIASFGRSAPPPMFDQLYNSTYQFQLGKDYLAIWVEMVHDVRVIPIGNNLQHRTDGIRPWFGDSIGHWEGDTLVVETTNYPSVQAFAGSWVNLKVTERFTRVSNDRMHYQFTIEDPTMWDAPWGGEYEFARSAPPFEYACHEGNYGLEGILAGARAEEAERAGKELDTTQVAR